MIALFEGDAIDTEEVLRSKVKSMENAGLNGIRNIGNSCYLSSVLQAFFHIPAFENFSLCYNITTYTNKKGKEALQITSVGDCIVILTLLNMKSVQ